MPGTARDVSKSLNVTPDQFWLPEVSIRAAAFYMGKLSRSWKSPRPPMDRHRLALASYNAGIGHILKSQKICGGPRLYAEIIICLPIVTGRHSRETIDYTAKIVDRWYPLILLE